MEIQKRLRDGMPLNQLKKYGICYKRHKRYPNLVLFKYHFHAEFQVFGFYFFVILEEVMVREARGLILDQDDNWNVVAFPYGKFFNYGEELAAEIDWDTAQVYEKLDGCIATLYWFGTV